MEYKEKLVRDFVATYNNIKMLEERLKQIKEEIVKIAEFPPGCKTGTVIEAGYRIKVALRENVTWDQQKLAQVKEIMGEQFQKVFRPEWKPISSKAIEAVCAEDENWRKAIDWARKVTEGAPTVTYERLDEEGEKNA